MEVDGAPSLVLDDLYVAEPDGLREFGRRRRGEAGERPEGVDRRPPPELGQKGMEEHVLVVAVAVRTDRLADDLVVVGVREARDGRPCGTAAAARWDDRAPVRTSAGRAPCRRKEPSRSKRPLDGWRRTPGRLSRRRARP